MPRLILAAGFCLSLLLAAGRPAAAQCVPLAQLLTLSSESSSLAADLTPADLPPALLRLLPRNDWAYRGLATGTRDLCWTSPSVGGLPDEPVVSWLSLRPSQATRDVVLKTTRGACVRQLRQELEQKLRPEPVTCPDCEGVRYQSSSFNVTIYSHKKGQFPFVVVLRQSVAAAPSAATGPAASRRVP